MVATEVLLPLARCQRCFTQSDRSLLFKWYNQQLKGRGWSKWQRFNNAKPRTPGRTCPTSHARRIQYTSALCGRRRRWAVILRLRPLYYDINFGIPGISSCMDQSTILRAHKSSTNIWILLLLSVDIKKNTTSIILTLEIRLFSKSSELYQGYIIKILCILIYSLYKIFGVFIIVLVYLFSCTICLLSCVSLRGICGVWKTYPSKMLMFSAKKSWSPYRKKQISFI